MKSSLFFLSVGLLALVANLTGTSGQKVTEKLVSVANVTVACLADGFGPSASIRWFHNDEAVASSIDSASGPLQEAEIPGEHLLRSTLTIQQGDWETGGNFTCLVEPKVLPPLTVQKAMDKYRGNPSDSNRTISGPRFRDDETELEMSISCIVEGNQLPGISIVWQENRSPLPEGTYTVYNTSQDPSFVYSTITLHQTLWGLIGKNYLCIIGHQGLEIQMAGEKTEAKV